MSALVSATFSPIEAFSLAVACMLLAAVFAIMGRGGRPPSPPGVTP